MSRIDYRMAKSDDAPQCSAILMEWVAGTSWYQIANPDSASDAAMHERIETAQVELAVDRGRVVGFSVMQPGYLDCLYTAKSYQGHGIGKALLDHCKARQQHGFGLWTLERNYSARRFYLREGFVETARSDGTRNEEKLPDIEYTWHGERNSR